MPAFNLESYEYHAYRRQHEEAARELLGLLAMLDGNLGQLSGDFSAQLTSVTLTGNEVDAHLLARITSATMCLFSDPNFNLSVQGVGQLLRMHRWLAAIFSASPMRNADAVLRTLNLQGPGKEELTIKNTDLVKVCLLFNGDSRVPLDLDALWAAQPALAAGMCLTMLAPRFSGSVEAHGKREVILPWLARKLEDIHDLEELPTAILHDAYMHCSYADRPDKHDVKRGICKLICKKFKQWGIESLPTPSLPNSGKPVLLIVLEWFNASHSIYRTHSRTMEAARELFRVVAIGAKNVDQTGRDVFDQFEELPADIDMRSQLEFVLNVARREHPHVLYMPSVGMYPLTMFLANIRIAPIQAYALGHPATTHAAEMDYVVVEEDYVGDPACFSEQLLLLPSDGMPYRPSAAMDGVELQHEPRENPQIVEIAVAATTMKLNPAFLSTLARIINKCNEAGREIRFHFLVGQAIGLVYEQVIHTVRLFLGDKAIVHRHQPYDSYMKKISGCDLFLNPFPFGNTNGIIDTITAGLVGVCKTGREVHEHIDQGLFTRLGLPSWMVATSNDEYVDAAMRLILNDVERCELRRRYTGKDKVEVLFKGRSEILAQKLLALVTSKLSGKSGTKVNSKLDAKSTGTSPKGSKGESAGRTSVEAGVSP